MDKDSNIISIEETSDGNLAVKIHWDFRNPHAAGHVVGMLFRSVVRSFEKPNPHRTREQITEDLLDGVSCMLQDEFFQGDNSDMVPKH